MKIIGDIGNTEIKICVFANDKNYIKKIVLKTNLISKYYLTRKLFFFEKI